MFPYQFLHRKHETVTVTLTVTVKVPVKKCGHATSAAQRCIPKPKPGCTKLHHNPVVLEWALSNTRLSNTAFQQTAGHLRWVIQSDRPVQENVHNNSEFI